MTVDEALKYIISMGVVSPRLHASVVRDTQDVAPPPLAAKAPHEVQQ
jgi:uncharacterized membrane protein